MLPAIRINDRSSAFCLVHEFDLRRITVVDCDRFLNHICMYMGREERMVFYKKSSRPHTCYYYYYIPTCVGRSSSPWQQPALVNKPSVVAVRSQQQRTHETKEIALEWVDWEAVVQQRIMTIYMYMREGVNCKLINASLLSS